MAFTNWPRSFYAVLYNAIRNDNNDSRIAISLGVSKQTIKKYRKILKQMDLEGENFDK